MSIRSAVTTLLQMDGALMTILTGGVYSGTEISRQETPSAFDANDEIQPCALLSIEANEPVGPYDHSARMFVVVRCYERAGYISVDAALTRIYTLLHRQRISGEKVFEIRHTGDVLDQRDAALDCAVALSRYQIVHLR